MKELKGFFNVYLDEIENKLFISNKPYSSREEASKGVFHSLGIHKLGCYEFNFKK
jgi:hypothetical protein